jgi:hypothetical protein
MNLACAAQERPSPPCRRGLPSCCFPTRPHCAQVTAPLLSVYSQRGRPPSTATSQRNQESCYLGDSGSVGRLDEAWAFSMRISVQRKRRQISPVAVSDDSQSPGHAHTHTHTRTTRHVDHRGLETALVVPLLTVLSSEVVHAEKSRRDRERPATPEHRVRHNRHEVRRPTYQMIISDQTRPDQTSKHVSTIYI